MQHHQIIQCDNVRVLYYLLLTLDIKKRRKQIVISNRPCVYVGVYTLLTGAL